MDHTGKKPLPRKLVITNRSDEARPQSVSLIDWNLKPTFKDAVFRIDHPVAAAAEVVGAALTTQITPPPSSIYVKP